MSYRTSRSPRRGTEWCMHFLKRGRAPAADARAGRIAACTLSGIRAGKLPLPREEWAAHRIGMGPVIHWGEHSCKRLDAPSLEWQSAHRRRRKTPTLPLGALRS
ncbi:hypothetical protein Sgleb_01410 [Streptomyces glebosus]|uniref:Uncharacterized protein n=1 Tax=Streptomyces glebosus TaxID=249580 RepID=A0A640SMJ1_9ACTN|nr:hypothetical protein Sgleb_01410 [Streptomyces glebosus]GHG73893.1 hypothetical protein GCM10010513_47440 [Streptomyces glebosus]